MQNYIKKYFFLNPSPLFIVDFKNYKFFIVDFEN